MTPGRTARRDDAAQLGVVAGRDRAASLVGAGQLRQLGEADGGGDIGHAEVVADDVVVVAHLHAVLAQQPDPLGQLAVVAW